MSDSTIFAWGGCDLMDIIENLSPKFTTYRKKYKHGRSVDYTTRTRSRISSSLLSIYSEPGDIGLRMYESLKPVEKKLSIDEEMIGEEIIKYPHLKFFKDNATKNDILLISFTMELYTKVIKGKEVITIFPQMVSKNTHPNRSQFQWFFNEYLLKEKYRFSFDQRDNLNQTMAAIRRFAKDIHNIFENRVIIIKSYIANFIKLENLNELKEAPVHCFQIPFYERSKLSENLDHSYAERNIILAAERFRNVYPSDIPLIDVGRENFFMHPNHRWGMAPFHYHQSTVNILTQSIEAELDNLISKINSKSIIPFNL